MPKNQAHSLIEKKMRDIKKEMDLSGIISLVENAQQKEIESLK